MTNPELWQAIHISGRLHWFFFSSTNTEDRNGGRVRKVNMKMSPKQCDTTTDSGTLSSAPPQVLLPALPPVHTHAHKHTCMHTRAHTHTCLFLPKTRNQHIFIICGHSPLQCQPFPSPLPLLEPLGRWAFLQRQYRSPLYTMDTALTFPISCVCL